MMRVEEVPEPAVEAGCVVLRPAAAGICGSEIEGYLGRMGNRTPPLIMGHEFAGTVTEVGAGVDAAWEGRRVAVNPLISCGECRLCRLGSQNLCRSRTLIGIQRPGAFAEYVNVPVGSLHELTPQTSFRAGALAEPLANGVHTIRLGVEGPDPVQSAVVLGAGTIGLLIAQAAALFEIPRVSVVEPREERRSLARELGADEVFGSLDEARRSLAGDGSEVDLVVDAVGAGETRRGAVELVRPGGRVVLIGLHHNETDLPFHSFIRDQISLRGTFAYTPEDFELAIRWLSEGRAGIGELPEIEPLEYGPEAFERLVKGADERVKIFLSGNGDDE